MHTNACFVALVSALTFSACAPETIPATPKVVVDVSDDENVKNKVQIAGAVLTVVKNSLMVSSAGEQSSSPSSILPKDAFGPETFSGSIQCSGGGKTYISATVSGTREYSEESTLATIVSNSVTTSKARDCVEEVDGVAYKINGNPSIVSEGTVSATYEKTGSWDDGYNSISMSGTATGDVMVSGPDFIDEECEIEIEITGAGVSPPHPFIFKAKIKGNICGEFVDEELEAVPQTVDTTDVE